MSNIRLIDNDNVAVIEFDLVGERVNKLSASVMNEFKQKLEEVKASAKYKALVITSAKKDIFIAGADIDEIKNLTTAEAFTTAIAGAHEIFNLLEDMDKPSVVAIHGPCLGGGCELALACDYRICSDDNKTRIGLPEVKLGIIPGFGGCVRLPRVIGLQASLDIILGGKAVDARKAYKTGLVDEAVPKELLQAKAMQYALDIVAGKKSKRFKKFSSKGVVNSILEGPLGRGIVYSQAKKTVLSLTKGFYPAPLKAIEVIKATYGMSDRSKALKIESAGFCEVAVTSVSKRLIDVFFMMEGVKKQNGVADPSVKPAHVDHISVLGAGVMGGGIAYQAADNNIEVRLKDVNNAGLSLGFKSARALWDKKLKRRRIDKFEFDRKVHLISGGLDFSGFQQTDVVIEAIVEDINIKKKVIEETAKHCKSDAIIATNTSSLSVNEMAKAHPHPENFLGMHFFNPVDKMPLVEVIRGEKTSDVATATIFDLAKKMGKTPVVVKDGPGFLVNRLLLPYMGEGMFLLQEGMAIDVVDRYFTHKFGMPMGPFRLLDEVGLDVGLKVIKIFHESLGDRIEVPEISKKLSATDRLGKKNSKGFYLYDERGKETGVDSSIYAELGLPSPTNPHSEKVCIERAIFQMINEASETLIADKIVNSASELDLAMIMGTGFPPFHGGLLRYADSVGLKYILDQLKEYSQSGAKRFIPLPSMVGLGSENKTFYPSSTH